jgi:hypothetical protein
VPVIFSNNIQGKQNNRKAIIIKNRLFKAKAKTAKYTVTEIEGEQEEEEFEESKVDEEEVLVEVAMKMSEFMEKKRKMYPSFM